MNLVRKLRNHIGLAKFCAFRPPNEEPMLPQMIYNLEKDELTSYFRNYKSILSVESWLFAFDRALKVSSKSSPIVSEILLELPEKLSHNDPFFLNLALDLCAQYDLRFEPWMEEKILHSSDLFAVGLKEGTFVWMLEKLTEGSPALQIVHEEFTKQFKFYSKLNEAKIFQKRPDKINLQQVADLLESDKKKSSTIKSNENLLRLLAVYTSKVKSLDQLSLLELRLAIECGSLSKAQLVRLVQVYSQLHYRLHNLTLLELVADFLAAKAHRLTFSDSLVLLEAFARTNLRNSHLLATITKQLDEDFLARKTFSSSELEWIGKVVFFLAKLESLREDIYETFVEIFKNEFWRLSSECVGLFVFAHSKMVSGKLEHYQSSFN